MKRRDRLSIGRSMLEPIPLDLKMATLTRLPAKFPKKTHQKRLLESKERDRNEDDASNKIPSIPFDVEVDILTRLPAKSVLKFRCVSKMWSSMTRSQRFIDSFSMSSTRSRFLIAFTNGISAELDVKRLFIFSSSYDGAESSSMVPNLDMTIPSVTLAHGFKCTSLHGFVGCSDGRRFTICNPSTRQVITFTCIGPVTYLGYDPVEDQFKALTLVHTPTGPGQSFQVHELITLGGGESPRRRKAFTTRPYYPMLVEVCIDGFVYYAAWSPTPRTTPLIVCFDVRYERLSFIETPRDVLCWTSNSILIKYKGKLASIVRQHHDPRSFDLWILEDVKKHDWSKQTCELPFPCISLSMTSPGTNKAGEIIFSPKTLPHHAQPFYIFYYNVESKDLTRVRIHGIADDQEFRRSYGITGDCVVSISPEHVESIASL